MGTDGGGDFVGIQATGPASAQGTARPEEKDGCVAQTQTLQAGRKGAPWSWVEDTPDNGM